MKINWKCLFANKTLALGVEKFANGTSLLKSFPNVAGEAKIQRCRLKTIGVKGARYRARKALERFYGNPVQSFTVYYATKKS